MVSCHDPFTTAPCVTPVYACLRRTVAQASHALCGIRAIHVRIVRKSCRGKGRPPNTHVDGGVCPEALAATGASSQGDCQWCVAALTPWGGRRDMLWGW